MELSECIIRLEAENSELKSRVASLESQLIKNKNKHKVT